MNANDIFPTLTPHTSNDIVEYELGAVVSMDAFEGNMRIEPLQENVRTDPCLTIEPPALPRMERHKQGLTLLNLGAPKSCEYLKF